MGMQLLFMAFLNLSGKQIQAIAIERDVISGINLFPLYFEVFDDCLVLQKKSLLNLYETKVKDIVKKLLTLDSDSEKYVFGKIVFLFLFLFSSLCF